MLTLTLLFLLLKNVKGTKHLLSYLILGGLSLVPSKLLAQADTSFSRINQLNESHLTQTAKSTEQLVVSASRSAKRLEDLPVTIHVITREEILQNGYITLVDALKSLPGIKVSQPGSAEDGEMFLLRGLLGNKYAKILVNNIPLKPSISTGLPIEAQLPVRQAERIEVIYGPAAAIYGSDAAIGVINIITKEANSKVFAQADVNMGNNRYRYANFTVGGKAGRNKNILQYSFFGNFMEHDDLNIFQDTSVYHPLSYIEQEGVEFDLGNNKIRPTALNQNMMNYYQIPMEVMFGDDSHYEGSITMPETSRIPAKSNLFGLRLKYRNWELTYLNMYRKTHSSIGRSPYLYKYNSPEYYLADYNNKFALSYNTQKSKLHSSTNLRYSMYRMDENSSFGVNFANNLVKGYQFAFSSETELEQIFTYQHKYFEAVGGLGGRLALDLPTTNLLAKPFPQEYIMEPNTTIVLDTSNFSRFGYNDHAYASLYSFLQTYLDFKKLKIVAGVRFDVNSLFEDGDLSPRIAATYAFNRNHSLRASMGSAYKPPAGNQLFPSIAFSTSKQHNDSIYYAMIPNPKLRPELFESLEIGYRGAFFNQKLKVDLAFYNTTIKNLITTEYTDASLQYSNACDPEYYDLARHYVNSSSAETNLLGFDALVGFHHLLGKYDLKIDVSGTLTKGSEKLSNGESIKFVRGIPENIYKLNVSAKPFRKAYVNIENTWMGSWQRSFLPSKDHYAFSDYSKIDGYFTTDFTFGLLLHKNLNAYFSVKNVFNSNYGGIDATTTDADLRYNPQLGRMFKAGLTFNFN